MSIRMEIAAIQDIIKLEPSNTSKEMRPRILIILTIHAAICNVRSSKIGIASQKLK